MDELDVGGDEERSHEAIARAQLRHDVCKQDAGSVTRCDKRDRLLTEERGQADEEEHDPLGEGHEQHDRLQRTQHKHAQMQRFGKGEESFAP